MRYIFKSILLVLILYISENPAAAQNKCREGPLDLFFILESSLSVGRRGFVRLKDFLTNVARQIGISADANRMAITLFNEDYRDIMYLNDTKGVPALRKLLADENFWSGANRVTNVGKAMNYIANTKFGPQNPGRRPELDAVCVLIMEGVASDLSHEAAVNLQQHCRIIVLGINRPNYFELSKIASEPTLGHLKTMQTYLDLARFPKWLSDTICKPPVSAMKLQRGRITDGSLQIVWEAQPYASGYKLQIRLSGKQKVLEPKDADKNATSVTFSGLKEGTKYSIDAWALDLDGVKGPKAVIFLSTGIKVPEVTLIPSSVTRTSFAVGWESAGLPGVTYYITVRRIDVKEVVLATSVSGLSRVISNLLPGRSYSVELSIIFRGERSDTDRRLIVHTTPDPPEVSVAYITDQSVKLEWKRVSGASTYGIRTFDIETSSGIELLVRVDNTANSSFIVEPLLSGKKYRFDVSSRTKAGAESTERSSVTARVAPSNPSRLELVSRTMRSINITWDPRQGVETYLVQFKTTTSPNWLRRLVQKTWFQADGLGVGSTYDFNVFSLGENSEYDSQNPASITVQTIPSKVEGLFVQGITQNSVTLQWGRTRGARSYLLRFRDATTKEILKTETAQQNQAEIGGLQAGITYVITAAAVGQDNIEGKESDPQLVITLPDIPGKPRLVGKTNSTLTFEWDGVQGAIQYMIEIQEDGSSNSQERRTSHTFFKFEKLKFGTWYSVRVKSVGTGGRVNNEQSEAGRGRTMPRIPPKPKIADLTATSVTVTWEKVKAAIGYILNIRLEGKEGLLESRNTTDTKYTINNLRGGETYYAALIAYGSDWQQTAESEWTLMETMPESPGQPRVLRVSSSTVILEWDEIKGAFQYIVSISDMRSIVEVPSRDTKFTVENLTPSTQYSFGLYSVAIEGTRNEKESIRVTAITAPSPPQDVRITDSTMTTANLAWAHVRGAVKYIVRYNSIREDEGKDSGMVTTDQATQTISNLTAGFLYEFNVYAIGLDGSESDPGVLIDGTLPAVPGSPLILVVGSTSVTLSWNPAKGAVAYIAIARSKPHDFRKEAPSNSTRVTINGLNSGTQYDFSVMSIGINERANLEESKTTTGQTLTALAANFKESDVTKDQISLSWDEVEGAASYSIELKFDDETPSRKFVAFDTNHQITQLEPGTTYNIRVASVGTSFVESDFSNWIVVTTIPETPGAPKVEAATNSSIEFSWDPIKGVVLYTAVLRKVDSGDTIEQNTTSPSAVFNNLESGISFECSLFTIGAGNRKNDKAGPSLQVQTTPNVPQGFEAVNSTMTTVGLAWEAVTGAILYHVYVMDSGVIVANQSTPDTSVIIVNLQPGSPYQFTVEAGGSQGGASEKAVFVSKSTTTAVPAPPTLTDITSTSAALEWTKIEGAVKYGVYYEDIKSGNSMKQETSTESVTISGLTAGTWYHFLVTSIGADEIESDKSEVLKEQTVPLAPTDVQVKNVGMNFITVVWDASPGASSYQVVYESREAVDDVSQETLETEETEATISNLSPGTDYVITVHAMTSSGRKSSPSQPLEENTVPSTPDSPSVETVEETTFTLTWEEVEGAASYVVEITPAMGQTAHHETQRNEWVEQTAEPGKWYKVAIMSKDKKNRGNGIPSDAMDVQTVCQRPSDVKMTQIGTDFAKLGWKEVEGADFYVITIHWSIRDEIINPFGGIFIEEGEIVSWEGKQGTKKDGFLGSKIEQYKIDPSEVSVKDFNASFTLQTKSNNIEVYGLEPATRYIFDLETVNKQGRVSERKSHLSGSTLPRNIDSISLVGIDESSVKLAWDAVKGANQYMVNVTRQSNGEVVSTSTSESATSVANLSPGAWYSVTIFTVGRRQQLNHNGSSEMTFQTTPVRPEDVRVTNVTTSSIEIDWEDSEGAAYYKIITRLTQPFETVLKVEESRTSEHLIEKLSPGTNYKIVVISVASGGRESRPSRQIVESTVPDKPANLKVVDISSTAAQLQWDDSTGAIEYIVSVMGEDSEEREIETKGTVITIENLSPGEWYEFWVKSVGLKDRVNTEGSNIARQQTVPESPDPVVVEEVTTTSMSLKWKNVRGIKQFQVIVEDEEGVQDVYNVTRHSYTLSQLLPGRSYSIYIVAMGTSGKPSEKSDTVTVATVPTMVTEFEITGVSTTHIGLAWTPVTGVSDYTVIVKDPSTGVVIESFDTQQPSYIVTSLKSGTTYLFSVIGKGIDGKQSSESPQIRVQTTPLSPTGIQTTRITISSVDMKWSPVPGARMYKVIIMEQESPDTIWRTDEVHKTEHTMSGLRSGTVYLIGVVTVGESGRESDSSEMITEATYPSSPEKVVFTKISTSSMELQWDPVHGALHYDVEIFGDDGTNKNVTVLEPKISVLALLPGTWYEVRAVAIGPMQRRSEPSLRVREQTEPAPPSKVQVLRADTTSISIQWEPVVGVKFYEIHVTSQNENNTDHWLVSVDTEYTINDLIPGLSHTIVIVGVGTGGRKSQPSEPVEQTTVPAALDDLIVQDATTTSITLRWEAIPGASSYTIVIRSSSDDEESIMRTIDTRVNNYEVQALVPGETYSFSIRSRGFGGKLSKESPRVQAQTVPLPPSNIEVTEVDTTEVQLSWKPSKGAGFYRVYTESESGELLKTDDVKLTAHTVDGLTAGKTYQFTVSAIGTNGRESEKSNSISQTTKPLGPSGVLIENVQTTSITLSWTPTEGSKGYKVNVENTDSGDKLVLETIASRMPIEALTPGTVYKIYIKSVGIDGQESASSKEINVQTIPGTPQNVVVVSTSETSIEMKWDEVVGAVRYLVTLTDSSTNTEVLEETSMKQISFTDLSPGTEYVFKVQSVGQNERLNTQSSIPVKVQTVSSPVQGLRLESTGARSLTLSWSKAPGVVRYIVNIRIPSNGLLINTAETTELEMEINNLSPGREYSFSVIGVAANGAKSKGSAEVVGSTGISSPLEPSVQAVRNSSVTLSWRQVNGAKEYIITAHNVDSNETSNYTTTDETIVAGNLEAGTVYSFSLIAVGWSGEKSVNSPAVTVTTIPAAPTIETIEDVSSDSLRLTWTPVKGAVRYIITVKWSSDSSRRMQSFNETTTATETAYVISLPESGTDYEIMVCAEGQSGISRPSAAWTENSLPASPAAPRTKAVTSNSISLIWLRVKGAATYQVLVSPDQIGEVMSEIVSQPSIELKDLAPGEWYEVQIFARDAKGRRNEIGSQRMRVQTVPEHPTSVEVTNLTMNSFALQWSRAKGALYYVVEVSLDEADVVTFGDAWRDVKVFDEEVAFYIQVEGTSVVIQGLAPGSLFQLQLKSVGDEERMSDSVSVSGATLPGTVNDIAVKRIFSDTVTLEWSDMRRADHYEVFLNNQGINLLKKITHDPIVTLMGLETGTWYTISVLSYDAQNRSSNTRSNGFDFQTVPAKINKVQASDIKTDGMTISWNSVKGASSYELKFMWRSSGASTTHLKREGTLDKKGMAQKLFETRYTNVSVTQLDPGTTYWYEVASFSEEGRRSEPSERKMESTLPPGIGEIVVNSVTETSISLSWDPVKGAQSYSVFITEFGEGIPLLQQEVERPQVVVGDLKPGSLYDFIISPIGENGQIATTESQTIEVKTLPLAPAEVTIDVVTASSIVVSWTIPEGAVRFEVVIEYTDGNLQSQRFTIPTVTAIAEITDLNPGVKYRICIIAFGNNLETSASAKSSVIIQRTTVSPPTNIKVDNFGQDFVSMSWDPSEGASSYIVYALNLETGRVTPFEVSGVFRSHDLTGLASGILYSFTVRAVSGVDSVMSEPSESVEQRTEPAAPRFVRVTDVSPTSMSIRWLAVTGADSYIIYVNENDNDREPITGHREDSITIRNLTPGTEYHVEIVAVTLEGIISKRSRRMTQFTAPNAPGNPKVKIFTSTAIEIEWEEMKGAASYVVTVMNEETGETYEVDVGSSLTAEVTNLRPGTEYSFSVRGENREQNLRSNESRKIVQTTYPEAPKVEVASFNPFSITLSWNQVKGASQYSIFVRLTEGDSEVREMKNIKATRYTIEDLEPGSEYELQVAAISSDGLQSDKSLRILQSTTPNTPSGLEMTNVTMTTMKLTWAPAKGANQYQLVLVNVDRNTRTVTTVQGVHSHVFSQLLPGTLYSAHAFALTLPDFARSEKSESILQRTLPVAPQNLIVYDMKEDSVSLEWIRSQGANTYTVYINKVDGAKTLERQVKNIRSNQVVVQRLSSGTTYRFEISAVTEFGLPGPRSEPVVQQTVPAPPQGIVVNRVTIDSFRVRWTKSRGATSYSLRLVDVDTQEDRSQDVQDVNTFTFSRLKPGTLYRLTLVARRLDADVTSRSSYSVLQRTLPIAPTGLVVYSVKSNSIGLEWQRSNGASTYEVVVFELDDSSFPVDGGSRIEGITQNYRDVTGLKSATGYLFEVYTKTGDGQISADSAAIIQRTKYPAPVLPSSGRPLVRLSDATSSSIQADWDSIPNAHSYSLVVKGGGAEDRTINEIKGTSITIRNLLSDVQYVISLIAVGRSGDKTPESIPSTLRTRPGAPETPTGITSSFTRDSVSLRWSPIPGAVSYEVEMRDLKNNKTEVFSNIVEPRYDVSGLSPGNRYLFRVFAVGLHEKSLGSRGVITGAEFPVPVMPKSLTPLMRVVDRQWDSVTVSLQVIPDSISYTVKVRKDGVVIREMPELTGLRHTISDLSEFTRYQLSFVALGEGGDVTEESKPFLSVSTLPNTPEIPTGVAVSDMSAETAVVTWRDAKRAVGYDVIVTDANTRSAKTYKNISESPFLADGLVFNTRYTVSVVAVGRYDKSEGSAAVRFRTNIPKPGFIRILITQEVTANEISLRWSPAAYAVSYTVTIRKNAAIINEITGIRGNSIRIRDLEPSTTYQIGVRAIGIEGDKGEDKVKTVRTAASSSSLQRASVAPVIESDEEEQQSEATKSPETKTPTSLKEAISALVSMMSSMPTSEYRNDRSGKLVFKQSSQYRISLWEMIETISGFFLPASTSSPAPSQEYEGTEGLMNRLLVRSHALSTNPQSFRDSVVKQVASEISAILLDIFTLSPQSKEFQGSKRTEYQEKITPLLEDSLLGVILGKFDVEVTTVSQTSVILTPSGKLPSSVVNFRIRQVGASGFLQTIPFRQGLENVRFEGLTAATEYEITATTENGANVFSTTLTTKSPLAPKPNPPTGIKVLFASRSYVSIRWTPLRQERTRLSYIVRVYRPGSDSLLQTYPAQMTPVKAITQLRSRTEYDVTVASFNPITKRESDESEPFRIRTR